MVYVYSCTQSMDTGIYNVGGDSATVTSNIVVFPL